MWLGVDGGGTKTEALLVDRTRVLGFQKTGPSNHQGVGMDAAVAAIQDAVNGVLVHGGYRLHQVEGVVLGLAGADFPEDVDELSQRLTLVFGQVPFRVVNDAVIALHAGTDKGWGIAAIAGTGGNVFGLSPDGRGRQVGGLGYEYGDYGSGIDIARDVLHYAFRSAERRGPKTALENAVLGMLGFPSYSALSHAMYRKQIAPEVFLVLAPVCFSAACDQDPVAINILQRQGRAIAESVVGCARLLDMETELIDVVLAGSLWLGQAPHMKDALVQTLARDLPKAQVALTDLKPVAGAALLAMREKEGTRPLRETLRRDVRFTGVE
ncbi:MAG: hypothetical protein M0Z36_12755 [Thermaerobacter sp.]|nr:hypothetical protein [Thermaerobacter sp.]